MAFNIFSTLNQNLQNFWGDAYDAYQAWKSKVGNVASTINNNLQDFWGDVYDVGSTIKKNVSNFWTQTYNQGKNVASTIQKNVWDYYEKWLKPIPWQVYDATIGRATDGFIDYAKGVIDYGREREASNVWIEDSKALKVMQAMKDEWYSKDEILAQMSQFDAEEKARKQQEWAQKQQSNYENASLWRKALAGSVNFVWGAEAGMMRLPAGVTDFVSGGTDYTKDTMQGINDFTSRSGAAKVGDIAGQIASTALIPWIGKIAPKGSTIWNQFLQWAVPGAIYGWLTPIMQKWNEATLDEIGTTALQMWALWGWLNVGLMRGVPAIIKGTKSGIKAGQYANGSISDKIWAGTQAFGKSIGRQTMKGTKEAIGSISSAYQNAKPFVKDTIKKPYQFTQDKVQSLLSNSSDETKSTIAQTYWLENQEIGALRNMWEKGVSDAMKKMEAIDKTALEWGWVNSIYDDLHKEIMTGVGKRSKEISTLEAQKDKILQSSPVVVKQAELESIFDDVLKAQGIQRTQKMTKKGIKNVYTVVGEGNITKWDIANIEKLYNEVFRTKWDVSALNMNTRIKNLQGNLYNSDGAAVYGSNSMTSTAKSIVAKVNELLKKKLPPEYGIAKEAQSKIFDKRNQILKYLKEEDNALALLSDDAIANMSEEAVVKLMNDSIAGNKMALVLRRLANSTTTGGDAKQLANIIKEFTGVDAESKAIALRAIAKLTGNQQIMNELGGLIEKGIMKWSLWFIRKTLAPSPDKVIKAVATKPPIVSKAKPKATKPPIVPKAKPKATKESAFKNNKGFINPSEIKKSLIPKKWADEARQFYDDLVYAGNSPIVAQRETAKRFGTIRAMSASKAGTMDMGTKKMYRWQTKQWNEVQYNDTNFQWNTEWWVFFTDSKETASKYWKNIIEIESNKSNTVSVAESNRLQKMAEKQLEIDIKNQVESDPIIEQMALWRPKAFAEYTKKPFIETWDIFWESGEKIFYKEYYSKPKVVPKVVESKAGTMDISKAPEALIQEARKYKSADEFIKAQGEPVYHGTNAVFDDFDISKSKSWWLGRWSYFTPEKSFAKKYWKVMERYIKSQNPLKIKANDHYSALNEIASKFQKYFKNENIHDFNMEKDIWDILRKEWYDSIEYTDWDSDVWTIIVSLDNRNIKTKEQLKQIYEQANKND